MVGPKPTHASFYVNEVSEVGAAIAKMAGIEDTSRQQASQQLDEAAGAPGAGGGGAGGQGEGSAVEREGEVLDAPGG